MELLTQDNAPESGGTIWDQNGSEFRFHTFVLGVPVISPKFSDDPEDDALCGFGPKVFHGSLFVTPPVQAANEELAELRQQIKDAEDELGRLQSHIKGLHAKAEALKKEINPF